MIDVDAALALLERETAALEPVELDLERARGCALAEPIVADRDFPPTDRSAMDGFAVRAEDCREPGRRLAVAGEVRAGRPPVAALGPGEACRVYTGAVLPPGADAVVMVEHAPEDRASGTLLVEPAVRVADHVRLQGSELRRGERMLAPGSVVRAAEVALLAAVGCVRVPVHRRPVVHVVSTGDEVVDCRRTPAEYQVRNSNAWGLRAQLAELGLEGHDLGIVGDDRAALAARFATGLAGDVLLVTGGVSVGQYDLVEPTLREAGVRVLFHGVAMKPGKPILAGRTAGCLVLALPGNPLSAFTGFAVLAAPALRRLLGHARWENPTSRAMLGAALGGRPGRATYHLARLDDEAGRLVAHPVPSAGSGDVGALGRANGFVVTTAADGPLAAGTEVTVMRWP